MVCKLDPKCEIQCDDCKSFYQRMSEKRNVVNEDDIYDISLSDWVDYMVDWSSKTKEEEK
jgi:hypothetical protein